MKLRTNFNFENNTAVSIQDTGVFIRVTLAIPEAAVKYIAGNESLEVFRSSKRNNLATESFIPFTQYSTEILYARQKEMMKYLMVTARRAKLAFAQDDLAELLNTRITPVTTPPPPPTPIEE